MDYQNIAEVYAGNDKIRSKLKEIVSNLTDTEANFLPADEKWTIANIVEHISIVEEGMTRISAKLLAKEKALGIFSEGRVNISESFLQKAAEIVNRKLEAPDFVRPTGEKSIRESMAKMEENRQKLGELRPLFETVACGEVKFPHPFLGDLNANEWLALIGGHELRHIRQIERLLEKIQQKKP
jgi:hypothetical protein